MGIINAQVPNYDHYNLEEEKQLLREALTSFGVRTDERFFENIKTGDIIEIYNYPENTQLYCNREFSRFCSYTLEQMQTIAFTKLFWRSDEDHSALMKRVNYVFNHESGAVPWDLPNHELIESLHPRKRTAEMKMGWISPCFDLKTGERRHWVSTLQVALIFEWDEDL